MRPARHAMLRMAGPAALRAGARANDVGMMLRAMTLARHAARRGEVPVELLWHKQELISVKRG
jgi:hypothetical protein